MSMSSCWSCINFFSLGKDMKMSNMIANHVAFSPPDRKKYQIISTNEPCKRGSCYTKVKFIHSDYEHVTFPWLTIDCYQLRKYNSKGKIVVLCVMNKSADPENTLIFSHGNSCDLGSTYPFLLDLSTQTKSNVISYDYTGYGCSDGTPSEKDLYSDIEQVLDFVINNLNTRASKIIL